MPRLEQVAGRHRGRVELVDLAFLHEYRVLVAVPVPCAQDRVVDIPRRAVRMDVDQLYGEIGVTGVRGYEQPGAYEPGDVQLRFERLGGVDQHIGTGLDSALVKTAAKRCAAVAADAPAQCRNRVHRVIGKRIGAGQNRRFGGQGAVAEYAVGVAAAR